MSAAWMLFAAKERVSAAETQSYLDFLGVGLQAGRQGMKLWEQQQEQEQESENG